MDIIRSEHTKPLNLMEIKVSVTCGMPANCGCMFFYANFLTNQVCIHRFYMSLLCFKV